MGLRRAWIIALVPFVIPVGTHAQAVRPMTAVRITTTSGRETVRLITADSLALIVENAAGEHRTIARSDITSVERRAGNAKSGAKILGGIGVGVGAAFGALVVAGLCDGTDCSDEYLPVMAAVAGVFGGIGAIGGATIGHYAGGWRPIDGPVRVEATDAVLTCFSRPRMEMLSIRTNHRAGAGRRLFNIGAVCGSGTVIGVELGNFSNIGTQTSRETADPQFGTVVTTNSLMERVGYRGVYLEQPLTTGRVRLHALASYGDYETETHWFESSYVKDYSSNPDYSVFHEKYPFTSTWLNTRSNAPTVGAKAALALGAYFTAGVAVRLHRAGTDAQRVESGVTLSFRP